MWVTMKGGYLLLGLLIPGGNFLQPSRILVDANIMNLPNITAIQSLNQRVEARINMTAIATEFPTESPAPSPSPSEAPTNDPERVTMEPSTYPTESPAPSPAPSEAPTIAPTDSPSAVPSAGPTISAAPSTTPSDTPSDMPSDAPSMTPSTMPTKSAMPSDLPSMTPSSVPSDLPSMSPSQSPTTSAKPSDMPSLAPSTSPSDTPSDSPSDLPSTNPSSSPTYSPTQATQKTKSSVSQLFLWNIPKEMDEMTLARFEVATLEFIRQAQPPTEGFELDILAVTVLTQAIIFPDHYEKEMPGTSAKDSSKGNERNLGPTNQMPSSSTPWETALEISFRTVGTVTSGRVPADFDLDDLALYGFENNFSQYLWQLGNSNEFFAPLKEFSDWPTQQAASVQDDDESKNAGFVMAILFSLLAFGLALYASYYVVRRHLRKQRNRRSRGSSRLTISPKPKLLNYSGPDVLNYLTNSTNDDSTYHDGDVEGGGAIHFVKSIDSDDQSMESVGLTPRAKKSPGSRGSGFFSDEDHTSPLKSPVTFQRSKKDNAGASGISFGLGDAQKKIKKWMTPRQSVERNSNAAEVTNRFSIGSKSVRFDPPEKDQPFNHDTPRKKSEPDAKKGGIYEEKDGLEIVKCKTNEDGEFSLPTSFVSRGGDDFESDYMSDGTPLSSLAESNTSIYFSYVGKSFAGVPPSSTGNPSNQKIKANYAFSEATTNFSEGPSTTVNDSRNVRKSIEASGNKTNSYFSNTGKSFVSRRASTGVPLSSTGVTIKENYAFSESSTNYSEAPGTVVNDRRNVRKSTEVSQASQGISKVPSDVSDNSQASRVQEVVAQIQKRQLAAQKQLSPHPVPARKPFANPHEGFETILGARSRSMEEDDVVQNMVPEQSQIQKQQQQQRSMPAPSSTPKTRDAYGFSFDQAQRQSQQQAPKAPFSTHGKVEAQSIKDKSNNKSRLSAVIKRPGTYDVYAPSGPIGIVVDTCKDGPSVHSLKSTSPMLGLITAGDLIIALDNEDTRGMSAAELTRLMAKKCRQRERKITLYSVDGF